MAYYSIEVREQAIALRKKGYSLTEIAEVFNIAKSTASLWLRNIELDKNALKRLYNQRLIGQYKTRQILLNKGLIIQRNIEYLVDNYLNKLNIDQNIYRIICALLYWCEGNKHQHSLRFTNSDPQLIKLFLTSLRQGFPIDESKLRILMHLHKYHDEGKQKEFWHQTTKIPLKQFNRTYWKPNAGKNIHEGYQGCIAISYYSSQVAKELTAIYNCLVQRGVG